MYKFELFWAFLLLPLPLFIHYKLKPLINNSNQAVFHPFFEAFLKKGIILTKSRCSVSRMMLSLAWLCFVFALANPQWVGPPQFLSEHGRNIYLALDLSMSMTIDDMLLSNKRATRLDVVKHVAKSFIDERKGDRLGLIAFGSAPYVLTPLTFDSNSLKQQLEDATVGLAGKTTALGDAIGMGIKRFKEIKKGARIMVLLTDGANNAGTIPPLKAAEIAKASGIKIYTIGLSADISNGGPGFKMMPFFQNAAFDLDESTLKKIADETNGHYFKATNVASLSAVYAEINALESSQYEGLQLREVISYYTFPLALCFILLILSYLLEAKWNYSF